MNRMMIVCCMVALMAAVGMAYPTGAPSSVCDDPFMEPTYHADHLNATGYNNTDQYTLQSRLVEGSDNLIEVTLSGDPFKGFVVRATTPNEENHGYFDTEFNDVPFHALHCSNSTHVAVTHSDPNPKSSITLMWKDNNSSNYVFQATVVPDIDSYVINIFENVD